MIVQIITGVAWAIAYLAWSFVWFKVFDPIARRAVGEDVIWAYDARRYIGRGVYRRWHWSVRNAPPNEVVLREFVVDMLGAVIVNVLAGAAPVLTILLLPPWAMYVSAFFAIPVYAIYWSGRYQALRG